VAKERRDMNDNVYNSIRWVCTAGVNRGYDLSNQEEMPIEAITSLYQKIAAQVYDETGVYISAVITPSRIVYHSEWGCPEEGEISYTFSGSCNTEFTTVDKYKNALMCVMQKLKEALQQVTLLLEIVPAQLVYLK